MQANWAKTSKFIWVKGTEDTVRFGLGTGFRQAQVGVQGRAAFVGPDCWVKGTEDTLYQEPCIVCPPAQVVWPREGEWWGAMSELPGEEFKTVNTMKDTRW